MLRVRAVPLDAGYPTFGPVDGTAVWVTRQVVRIDLAGATEATVGMEWRLPAGQVYQVSVEEVVPDLPDGVEPS